MKLWMICIFPFLLCLVWSTYPAAKSFTFGYYLKNRPQELIREGDTALTVKRRIQKRFLKNGMYLPLYDIDVLAEVEAENKDKATTIKKLCGSGRVSMWIPLRYRFPFVGEKVLEWCLSL